MTVDERRRAAGLEVDGTICTQPDRLRDGEHSTQHSIQHIRQNTTVSTADMVTAMPLHSWLRARVDATQACRLRRQFAIYREYERKCFAYNSIIIDIFIFIYLLLLLLSSVVVRSVRIEAR